MKGFLQLCLFLGLLGLILPVQSRAQDNFNDIGDVLYLNDSVAFVCSFDNAQQISITQNNGTSAATTLNLGRFKSSPDKVYFFGKTFRGNSLFRLLNNTTELVFGDYRPSALVTGLVASQEEFNTQINLTWDAVPGASGYVILRTDHSDTLVYASNTGGQLTSFTDTGLKLNKEYTYQIAAYGLDAGNRFFSGFVPVTGKTKPFDFFATTDNEAVVNFSWVFDNHLLLGLDEQAGYFEITDNTDNNNEKVVYEDQIVLSDLTEDALIFEKAVNFQGDENDGVLAKPGLGNLNKWTLEFWVKLRTTSGTQTLFDDGTNKAYIDEARHIILQYNQGVLSSSETVNLDQWTHFGFTWDSTAVAIYKGGQLISMNGPKPAQDPSLRLGDQLQFGKAIGGGTANLNGSMGMLRIWNLARTASQMADDYKDLFSSPLPNLLAQWTFGQEAVSVADGINGKILRLSSTDAVTYPVRWTTSLEFVEEYAHYSHSLLMDYPHKTGDKRSYTIRAYEVGSGKLLSINYDTVVFKHPGNLAVEVNEETNAPYLLDVAITPASRYADQYKLARINNQTGAVELLKVLPVPDFQAGNATVLDTIHFRDAYALDKELSIRAGVTYTYEVTPFYSQMDKKDEDFKTSAVFQALDFEFSATPVANAIELAWNPAKFSGTGYDTLFIYRNDDLLRLSLAETGGFTDTMALHGTKHRYELYALKDGQLSLMQFDSAGLAPNGYFKGRLISKSKDFVVINKPVTLLRRMANKTDTVGVFQSNHLGEIEISGLTYGMPQANFELVSTSGKTMLQNTFVLSPDKPAVRGVFVKYDTAYEENSLASDFNLTASALPNALKLEWNEIPEWQGAPVFNTLYRDNKLVDIVHDVTRFIDSLGTAGQHSYCVVAYVFKEGKVGFVSTTASLGYPSAMLATTFNATTTPTKVASLSWTYPAGAPLQSFLLSRTGARGTHPVVQAALNQGLLVSGVRSFQFTDSLGFPGKTYNYVLQAITHAGDTLPVGKVENFVYPAFAADEVVDDLDAEKHATQGAFASVSTYAEKQNWPSWDGLMLVDAGNKPVLPLEKSLKGADGLYRIYHPAVGTQSGQLRVAVYKHTDEGLFISNTESNNFSNALVAPPLMFPTKPALATSNNGLQNPVLTATKNVKGHIFVSWTYPTYTTVTFKLSRKIGDGAWETPVTLPGKRRAYLDTAIVNKFVEYKLYAQRPNGEKSSEVWDFGFGRQYVKVEGYVFDNEKHPQPHVFVGIDHQWIQTDSAGYYSLSYLELPEGNLNLEYVVPGTSVISTKSVTINRKKDTYYQNILLGKTNAIVPEDRDWAGVFAVTAEADTTTLTNKIRWRATNDRYSGFKVFKGFAEQTDLVNGEEMVFVDSLDNIEDARYTYTVVPYFVDRAGEERVSGAVKEVTIDFAFFNPPGHVNAYANEKQGTVELIWAHKHNNVDGYVIERNDKEVGKVPSGKHPVFIDSTGLPNQVYRYNIYSYLERDGRFIKSNRSILTEALFPYTGIASNVVASVGKLPDNINPENFVVIEWDYPTDVTVGGAILKRGVDSIAAVYFPQRMIIDSLGVPETYTTYSVSTFDFKEGQFYRSKPQPVNIVFPKLQKPVNFRVNNVNVDTVWLEWEYHARGVNEFEVLIVNNHLKDTVVLEKIANNRTSFRYFFGTGTAGVSYTYSVRAVANRNRQTYYSDPVPVTQDFPLLPEPVFTVNYAAGEQKAVFTWGYGTQKNTGFKLTIRKNGDIYSGAPDDGGEPITYDGLVLPPIQRSYSFIPAFGDLRTDPTSFKVELTAFQNTDGARTSTRIDSVGIQLKSPLDRYPQNVSVSEAENNITSIFINWEHSNPVPGGGYVIYRDGSKVTNVSNLFQSFEDRNTSPGVTHVYTVAAKHGLVEYPRTVKGQRLGDGMVSVSVLSKYGTPMRGDSLQITAVFGTESIMQTGITNNEGFIYFSNLAYKQSGIDYFIRPLGNPANYEKSQLKATLNLSTRQAYAGNFINTKSRIIRGRITSNLCPNGCPRENILVKLNFVNTQNDTLSYTPVRTDEQGAFSFAIPYMLDAYKMYQLVIGNEAVDETFQPIDSIGYYYLNGSNMVRKADSTLVIDFPVAVLQRAPVHEVAITETIGHPLNVEITGPGVCTIFDCYEFLLRIYDAEKRFEKMVWTQGKIVQQMLPPDLYHVEVIDVNKPDAFSQSVLDYFRTRRMTVDNKRQYKQYRSTVSAGVPQGNTALRDRVSYFRYNERANLTIKGLSQIENECGRYVMDSKGKGGLSNVKLNLVLTQQINSKVCAVTSGYILPRFSGGNFDLDTIQYNHEAWDTVTVFATTPNMAAPYKQLLEFYYYDASHNFQGMTSAEILVSGEQNTPGRDVFIYPAESEQLVPLFVLRDPPGDLSSSSISESSKFDFQLERRVEYSGGSKFGGSGKDSAKDPKGKGKKKDGTDKDTNTTEIAGQTVSISGGPDLNGSGEIKKTKKYSLSFNRSISTLGHSQTSENLSGFLDGPDADIVVGASVLMSYGIVQELYLDGCEPHLKNKMAVDPDSITTTWVYTRSQIKNTVHYYESLVKSDGDDGYVSKEGKEFSFDSTKSDLNLSPEEIATRIGRGKEMFEHLLDNMDRLFTPACEMCDFARDFDRKAFYGGGTSSLQHSRFARDYHTEIKNFCKDNIWLSDDQKVCKSLGEEVEEWDESTKNDYRDAYRAYVTLKEMVNLYLFNTGGKKFKEGVRVDELEDYLLETLENGAGADIVEEAASFSPLENITFGAGASVYHSISKEASFIYSDKTSSTLGFSFELSTETEQMTEGGTFIGLGGGTNLENSVFDFSFTKKYTPVAISFSTKTDLTSTTTNTEGLHVSYSLGDDDDGDHFSVDVFDSWTDGATKQGPFFHVVGGRSSCPYEEGTIPRDMPRIQLLDENDSLYASKYYDLDPNRDLVIPIALSSGNLFGEQRLVMVGVPLGTNKNSLNLLIENLRVNVVYGGFSVIAPDENYYTNLVVSRGNSAFYDFEDVELVVKPYCIQGSQGRTAFWENEAIYDTIKLEFHYRKPVSPIVLSTDMASWFITDDKNDLDDVKEEAAVFKLSGYDVQRLKHSMKEVFLEYKKKNEEVWRRMTDYSAQSDLLPVDSLLGYYRQKMNTYPEPLYPFTWDISDMNLEDGQYQIRATVVHEKAGFGFSNILEGTIDRKHPEVAGTPAPADGLLSRGDEVSITFDEPINGDKFRFENNDRLNISGGKLVVRILNNAGQEERRLAYNPDVPALSAYSYTTSGSKLTIVIKQDTLKKYDGRRIEIALSRVKDMLGNVSDPQVISWSFKVDYFKQTPSPFKFSGPQNALVNRSTAKPVLKFIVSEYDVYQVSHSVENIDLQYKGKNEDEWQTIDQLTIAELVSHYQARGDNSMQAVDTLYFNTTGLADDTYTIRAVLMGSGVTDVVSSTFSCMVDRTAPAVVGTPEPSDRVYELGDKMSFTFSEPIGCNGAWSYKVQVTPYGQFIPIDLTPQKVECAGSKIEFTFVSDVLRPYFGNQVSMSVTGITDLAGNAPDTEVKHTFAIGKLGNPTSPVSILQSEDKWVINVEDTTATFTLHGYDLFELKNSLDSIIVEYSGSEESVWHPVDTVKIEALRKYFNENQGATVNNEPVYPVTWWPDTLTVIDGKYAVRAVAYGDGFPQYSAAAAGEIDRIQPAYLAVSAPQDNTIRRETAVVLNFTEEIDEESLETAGFTINQILGSTTAGGRAASSKAKLETVMYTPVVSGKKLHVYFDKQVAAQYEGELLQLSVHDLRDLNGNRLRNAVNELFEVRNVYADGSASEIRNLDFSGHQMDDGAIQLQWNNCYDNIVRYELERSDNGLDFGQVAAIKPQSVERYGYQEYTRFDDMIYYRLKLFNAQDSYIHSKVVALRGNGKEVSVDVVVAPNPVAKNRLLRFTVLGKAPGEKSIVRIADLKGIVLLERELETGGNLSHSIQLGNSISPGVYILNVKHPGSVSSVRFIVE